MSRVRISPAPVTRGPDAGPVELYRAGGTVFAHVNAKALGVACPKGASTKVGDLPAGWRPMRQVIASVTDVGGGYVGLATFNAGGGVNVVPTVDVHESKPVFFTAASWPAA